MGCANSVAQSVSQSHLYGWEVRIRVALAAGSREVVMGVSTKGIGHYVWTCGTPRLLSQVKDMIFGPQAGVGEVARITFLLVALRSLTGR